MHHHSIITIQNTSVRLLKQDITKVDKILFLPNSNSDLAKIKFCQIRICQIGPATELFRARKKMANREQKSKSPDFFCKTQIQKRKIGVRIPSIVDLR